MAIADVHPEFQFPVDSEIESNARRDVNVFLERSRFLNGLLDGEYCCAHCRLRVLQRVCRIVGGGRYAQKVAGDVKRGRGLRSDEENPFLPVHSHEEAGFEKDVVARYCKSRPADIGDIVGGKHQDREVVLGEIPQQGFESAAREREDLVPSAGPSRILKAVLYRAAERLRFNRRTNKNAWFHESSSP